MIRFERTREGSSVVTLTFLRVAVGLILAVHGWMKLNDISGTTQNFAHLGIPEPQLAVYLAILAELGGGCGLLFGFLTRLAGFGAVLAMLGAIVYAHLGNGPLARNGGWEYPLTLLLVSLHFVARGAGPFSIDWLIQRARRDRPHRGFRHREPRVASRTPVYGR